MKKIQRPTPPNSWLTKLCGDSEDTRIFATEITYNGDYSIQWEECSQDFYDSWQAEYNPPQEELPEEQSE